MTTESITTKKDGVYRKHQRTHADAELLGTCSRIVKPHGLPRVIGEYEHKDDSQVKKIPVNILQDQGKGVFPPIGFARFGDGACRWVGPKGFVICSAIVVAGEPHASRRPQDQQRRREGY